MEEEDPSYDATRRDLENKIIVDLGNDRLDLAFQTGCELLRLAQKRKDRIAIAYMAIALGRMFSEMKQHDRAVDMYRRALSYILAHTKIFPNDCKTAYADCCNALGEGRKAACSEVFHTTNRRLPSKWRICARCDSVGKDYSKCSGCLRAWYCGSECQKLHHPDHTLTCNYCAVCKKTTAPPGPQYQFCMVCRRKICSPQCFRSAEHTCCKGNPTELCVNSRYRCSVCGRTGFMFVKPCACGKKHAVCDVICARISRCPNKTDE